MAVKYIIRFDDITPLMNWEKFNVIAKSIINLGIKPIIGVVPENRDLKLNIGKENINFWDTIRNYQSLGWGIAQHGCYHQYTTKNSGILGLSNKSEFAGLDYKDQFQLINTGKQILNNEGINTDLFMAPSHSFDITTIKVLKECKIKYITDGFGLYPYDYEGITLIPQLYASPLNHYFGIYTICLHTNTMNSENLISMVKFITNNSKHIISYEAAIKHKDNSLLNRYFFGNGLKFIRNLKKRLVKK
tara:strand:- start:1135 stop:1872 length:738 start_codon:yes stop_codon:yes gene_type:complete